MSIASTFETFFSNIAIKNADQISKSYKGVTKKLNQIFWDIDSDTLNSLQVGSYGRKTAINGISDLDMIFVLPIDIYKRFNSYENNGQSSFLQEVKNALLEKYPRSDIFADGQVIVFNHTNYRIEVVPAFELSDGSFRYADTHDGGSWKITKPREEIDEIGDFDKDTSGSLKKLCRMSRAWKNHTGVAIGGLLIDTLCYNFLKENTKHHNKGYKHFPELFNDFFNYLVNTDKDQSFWFAPGSNQKVFKKQNFIPKAKKAKKNCESAINSDTEEEAIDCWEKIFGILFAPPTIKSFAERSYRDTEEYIENEYQVDIKEVVYIDCKVTQEGFRPTFLRNLPVLKLGKKLEFFIVSTSVEEPYRVLWKVRNVGSIAEKKDQLRGQIITTKKNQNKIEHSHFGGPHFVECYIVKNGIVIARDRISVGIAD